jgi:hypothetical protein
VNWVGGAVLEALGEAVLKRALPRLILVVFPFFLLVV